MKRLETGVLQTRFGKDGNCIKACFATLLGVGLDDVPDYRPDDGVKRNWYLRYEDWFQGRGWLLDTWLNKSGAHVPRGWSVVGLEPGPRGLAHACVAWSGHIVWDPHPEQNAYGLEEAIEDFYVLYALKHKLVSP